MFDFTILYWIPLLIVIWWLISKGHNIFYI